MIRKESGISMVEIMVTIVIVSIGLLGMAALQIAGIRGTSNAAYRTQATVFANDIAERMRANITAVDNNQFFAVTSAVGLDCSVDPAKFCGEHFDGTDMVASESCTPAQMASYDVNVLFCGEVSGNRRVGGINNALVGSSITIACIDTNPPSGADADGCTNRSPHRITVNWTERNPNKGEDNVNQSISMTIQP